MHNRSFNLSKAIILFLFAGLLAQKVFSGKIYDYIAPKFSWMAVLAIVVFLFMAASYAINPTEHGEHGSDEEVEHGHNHKLSKWSLIAVCVPIIIGWVIPAQPVGAGQVANQGISTDMSAPIVDLQSSLTIIPAERNILDWVRAIGAAADPAALNGQKANVIGFVYRDARFTGDQLMVARFAVTCCVADARALGLVVETPDASQYATGAWVKVSGSFIEGVLGSNPIPVIQPDSIKPVDQPDQPYLYP